MSQLLLQAKSKTSIHNLRLVIQIMISNNEVDFHLQQLAQINLTNSYIMPEVDQYQTRQVQHRKTNVCKSIKYLRTQHLSTNQMVAIQTQMPTNIVPTICSHRSKTSQTALWR